MIVGIDELQAFRLCVLIIFHPCYPSQHYTYSRSTKCTSRCGIGSGDTHAVATVGLADEHMQHRYWKHTGSARRPYGTLLPCQSTKHRFRHDRPSTLCRHQASPSPPPHYAKAAWARPPGWWEPMVGCAGHPVVHSSCGSTSAARRRQEEGGRVV
jgi:hypothetical protein